MDRARRIVVTGASGFIGSALVARLRGEGRDVVAVSRSRRDGRAGRGEIVVENYRETAWAAAIGPGDILVHLAATAHRAAAAAEFDDNVRTAEAIAQAAHAGRAGRVVFASSIGVLGDRTRGRPFTERDLPDPREPYARSKLLCEQAVADGLRASATEWVVVRPPLVYGPQAPGNFARLVGAVAHGRWLPLGSIRNARHMIGLDNLLDLFVACIDSPAAARETFLAADDQALSTPDIVRCIAQGLQTQPRLFACPPGLLRAGAAAVGKTRMAHSLLDSLEVDASKARRVLGWAPRLPAGDGITQAARQWRHA